MDQIMLKLTGEELDILFWALMNSVDGRESSPAESALIKKIEALGGGK